MKSKVSCRGEEQMRMCTASENWRWLRGMMDGPSDLESAS